MGCEVVERHLEMAQPTTKKSSLFTTLTMFITHTLFTTPVTDLRHLPTTTGYDKNGKP